MSFTDGAAIASPDDEAEIDLPETVVTAKPESKPAFLHPGLTGRGGPYVSGDQYVFGDYGYELRAPGAFSSVDAEGKAGPGYLESALVLENAVVNAIEWISRPTFKPDADFSSEKLIDTLGGWDSKYFRNYADNFLEVDSIEEARNMMARIDQKEKHAEIIARSGFGGILASVAAGTLDPTILIPMGGYIKAGTLGSRMARAGAGSRAGRMAVGAGEGAVVGGTLSGAHEAFLQEVQPTTPAEYPGVGYAIGAGTLLGSVCGGVAFGRAKT